MCLRTGALLRWWVLGGMKGVNACAKLCEHLEALVPRLPEAVVIERQSKRSGTMLAVQCWTQAFYVSRGVRVHPIAAKLKSDMLGEHTVRDYRDRKKAAVAVAAARIPEPLREQWRALKKKDDPADACCQAWAWLGRRGVPTPEALTL